MYDSTIIILKLKLIPSGFGRILNLKFAHIYMPSYRVYFFYTVDYKNVSLFAKLLFTIKRNQ